MPDASLRHYIAIARPDHWNKNIFVVFGAAIVAIFLHVPLAAFWWKLVIGLFSTCLIASANYVINEWLDAEFDRHHPVKHRRPSVSAGLRAKWVYTEYVLLIAAGLGCATLISPAFLITSALLLGMGVLYNVQPFRLKDKGVFDVLVESINNPIRLMLGWFIVTVWPLPPSSLVISYWMGGAFLMAIKRFGEYRLIGDPARAGAYRKSFRYYTEERLLISSFFYAMTCALFLGVFLIKYRVGLILSFPFIAIYFAWYLRLAFQPDSPVQYPERLHKQRGFMLYTGFLALLLFALLKVDLGPLHWLLGNTFLTGTGRTSSAGSSTHAPRVGSQGQVRSATGVLAHFPSDVRSAQAWYGHAFMVGGVPVKPTADVSEPELLKHVGTKVTVSGVWNPGVAWKPADEERDAQVPESLAGGAPVIRGAGIMVRKLEILKD